MSQESKPVVAALAWTDSEAAVIKSLLEAYNIPCHYVSEIPHRIYPLSAEGLARIRIYVPAPMADEAKRLLDEHRRRDAHLRLVDDE